MIDANEYVAVGALGGSGIRVAAETLRGAGFYMGSKQNGALDNLLFTFLFQRSRWFAMFPFQGFVDGVV